MSINLICVECGAKRRKRKDYNGYQNCNGWNSYSTCPKCMQRLRLYESQVSPITRRRHKEQTTFKFRRDKVTQGNRTNIINSTGDKTIKLLERYLEENL